MKAMILAAGLGTRLKPITDSIPKALVHHNGKTLLQIQIEKLISSGAEVIVINTHHLAEKIIDYINNNNFGIPIHIIKEEVILGTGGGVLNAVEYLKNSGSFIVVNADIETNFDYKQLYNFHLNHYCLASLAVQKRKTSRYLLFDENNNLISRTGVINVPGNVYAFNGLHVISDKIFGYNFKIEYCDIIDLYLKLAKEGEKIKSYDVGNSFFKDLGKKENLFI
jgi:N-acetyl-alpha-D-muramate 1-phosphate uridylyltransferase